ncbi:hypothetical protein FORC13_p075 (plasmid) [Bacillus cereus]|nr:hypothetical protein FORC13_p075 [Bacillus cereus]
MNTQDVGAKKPSLFGMITSPGVQFERMKTNKKVWGMFLLVALLQGFLGGLSAYVIHTSPEMLKMKKELGELAGQSSLTSEVISGIGSGFGSGTTQYTSLGLLFTEGTFAYGIGNTIEVFYVWNLVLIWLKLHIKTGLSKVKASIPIIVLFIIKVVFLAAIIVLIAKVLPGMPM